MLRTGHSNEPFAEGPGGVAVVRDAGCSPVHEFAGTDARGGIPLSAAAVLSLQRTAGNRAVTAAISALKPSQGRLQRKLAIDNSPTSPFNELRFGQFRSLRKRHGLSVNGLLWLRTMATAEPTFRFAGWREAIAAVNNLPFRPLLLAESTAEMSRPFVRGTSPNKFGDAPSAPVTMKDAHGFVGMVDYILHKYPIDQNVFVSPGASADPIAMAMRIRGAAVVEIPLSGIKPEKLTKGTRPLAVHYVRTCFGSVSLDRRSIVIFDAVISGDALVNLKDLIGDAFPVPKADIKLVGLNKPAQPSGEALQKSGQLDVVSGNAHVGFVKQRIESQSYKLDVFKRIFPKFDLSELTPLNAGKIPARNHEVEADILALVMAMHTVAGLPYREVEPPDIEEPEQEAA